uniref:Putative ovule protein n=1 Tax=Solanum chacoense TaxID=4108 RepID=A0A0V0HNI3_SOLCH
MKDSDSVKEYSSKLMEIVNQIRILSETFSDQKVVEKILVSLPDKFESKISAIEESCDLTTLTIAELISKLQVQEQRVTMRSEGIVEDAFQARHKFKHQKESRKVWLDKSGEVKSGGNQGDLSIKENFHLVAFVRRQTT